MSQERLYLRQIKTGCDLFEELFKAMAQKREQEKSVSEDREKLYTHLESHWKAISEDILISDLPLKWQGKWLSLWVKEELINEDEKKELIQSYHPFCQKLRPHFLKKDVFKSTYFFKQIIGVSSLPFAWFEWHLFLMKQTEDIQGNMPKVFQVFGESDFSRYLDGIVCSALIYRGMLKNTPQKDILKEVQVIFKDLKQNEAIQDLFKKGSFTKEDYKKSAMASLIAFKTSIEFVVTAAEKARQCRLSALMEYFESLEKDLLPVKPTIETWIKLFETEDFARDVTQQELRDAFIVFKKLERPKNLKKEVFERCLESDLGAGCVSQWSSSTFLKYLWSPYLSQGKEQEKMFPYAVHLFLQQEISVKKKALSHGNDPFKTDVCQKCKEGEPVTGQVLRLKSDLSSLMRNLEEREKTHATDIKMREAEKRALTLRVQELETQILGLKESLQGAESKNQIQQASIISLADQTTQEHLRKIQSLTARHQSEIQKLKSVIEKGTSEKRKLEKYLKSVRGTLESERTRQKGRVQELEAENLALQDSYEVKNRQLDEEKQKLAERLAILVGSSEAGGSLFSQLECLGSKLESLQAAEKELREKTQNLEGLLIAKIMMIPPQETAAKSVKMPREKEAGAFEQCLQQREFFFREQQGKFQAQISHMTGVLLNQERDLAFLQDENLRLKRGTFHPGSAPYVINPHTGVLYSSKRK